MTNPVKGEATVRLQDGRVLTLVADHAAYMKAAVAYTGKTKLKKLLSDIQPLRDEAGEIVLDEDGEPEKDTIPATCALFYGMLDAYHPDIPQRDATNILIGELEKVGGAIGEAITRARPELGDAEDRQGVNPPKSQLGKISGGSGAKSASTRKPSGGQRRKRSK